MVVWGLTLTESFQTATRPHLSRAIDEEVKSGTITYSVNRPYSYMLFHLFGFLGRVFPNLLVNVFLGVVAVLMFVGPIPFSVQGIGFGLILLSLGYLLDFTMSFLIGLLAFWVEDTVAFTWIYQKSQVVFGGLIVPLALFPDTIRRVAEWSPMSQLYYGAGRLAVNFDMALFERFIVTQVFWIVFFMILARIVFARGMKHISINGG
jgi:ABC-2 type transport system permease protein